MKGLILSATNAFRKLTNLQGSGPTETLSAIPLGTVGDSATGEVGVKVIVKGAVPIVPGSQVEAESTVQTSATGASWVTLGSNAASEVTFYNASGTDLEVRRAPSGAVIPLPNGFGLTLATLANSNELQIRRKDQSNTQVTITFTYAN
jgi:hypothetical protein